MIRIVLLLGVLVFQVSMSHGQEVSMEAVGIRGGINFNDLGIPPTEKEDFAQYDLFGVVNLPWRWDFQSGWEIHTRANGSLGAIQGGGDTSFIATLGPGFAFRYPAWRFTFDIGGGGAFLSDYTFGRQDIGGPFQFVAHGAFLFDLTDHIFGGYRFHHMSDADIYGSNRGVDLHMIELGYYF